MVVQYFAASTLDGFIATTQDDLGWLLSRDVDPDGPHGYNAFLADVGAVAMGSTTYEWVREHGLEGGAAWPYDMPTWVLTHRTLAGVPGADIRFISGGPQIHINALMESAAGRNLWIIGGGPIAAQFADAGLLDEVWVQFAPVTIGAGRPFLPTHVELELIELVRNREFACLRYRVRSTTPH